MGADLKNYFLNKMDYNLNCLMLVNTMVSNFTDLIFVMLLNRLHSEPVVHFNCISTAIPALLDVKLLLICITFPNCLNYLIVVSF